MKPKSIIVLSGGQDSVTTFYQALVQTVVVGAVHFNYGQRHAIERECARHHSDKVGVPLQVIDVPAFAQLGDSALVNDAYGDSHGDVNAPHARLAHLPASFVPGRNLIFLTLAAALAMKLGATQIWTGVCQEDYSGYPDCRAGTILNLEVALQMGLDFPDLEIVTPLMNLTKAQTFALAEELGILGEIIEHTHTCYNGDHSTFHDFGYGCGECPACEVRKNGFAQFELQSRSERA